MRTRSSSNPVGESSPNPTSSNLKHRNHRRSKQPFILEESPVDTMADQRTMAELLRAPTEGYAEAIMVPPILAEQFELKHSLINMMTLDQFFGLEKDNPHDHIRWFNKITSTIKYKDVPNSAIKLMLFPFSLAGESRHWLEKEPLRSILTWEDLAWDRYKVLLRACPHHGFTELHQLDTFYNALNPADQDSLNFTVGGNLLESRTQDVLTIIENKFKIAKLTHAVNQQTSAVTTAMTAILKQFQATLPPASVKAVEEICVTCGGAHQYYQCLAADGNTFLKFQDNIQGYVSAAVINYNQGNFSYRPPGSNSTKSSCSFKNEMKTLIQASMSNQTNELKNMMASFFQMNTASTSGSGPLPSNTIANQKGGDERVEETLTDPELAVILKKLLEKLRDPGKFLIPCGFSELKCKALADQGASINLMPLSVWKKVRPFLRIARALIDVHEEELILRDGDERLTLNMRHETSSYSNQPQKESINMINIYDDSYEDYLEDLFATNHLSGNPTFSSHTDLTSPKVKDDIFDPEGDIVLIKKLLNLDSTKDLSPPYNINSLSGSTTSSSPDHLLEEFADELALITFPSGNDDLSFDIESDLREIEYLLNHDPTKEMDSILEDSVDKDNLADPNDNLFDTILEMFTDEHTLDYSSPPLYDDLVELEFDNEYVYDDPFDSKEEKIKESKLLIDELDLHISSDFLPSPEYDSFLFEDFSKVDAFPSTNNEEKVFNPRILIHENLFEVTTRVAPDKNVKKIAISHASLILEDFNPLLYELLFHKEVPGSKTLLSFSSKNEEKVFKPGILTCKGVHTSFLLELSHRGTKDFKVIKIFESPMEIFSCSYGEDIRILDVPCLHFYPP
nr:hypothetical protein [Tanacetum cinerariifolium]